MKSKKPILIGIAGGSGSGKTFLAQRIRDSVGSGVGLVSMDQYFQTASVSEARHINFDHPSHLDIDRMVKDLKQIRRGRPTKLPLYDFRTMIQTPNAMVLDPVRVVIVEGLFVLSSPIVDLLDFTCFLDVEHDQQLLGRLLRDLHERTTSVEQTIDRYQRYVRPSYEVFVAPTKHNADVVIDFTFRRSYFGELLSNMIADIVDRDLDVDTFLDAVKGDNYRLGYSAEEPVMPPTADIRALAKVYPEHMVRREPTLRRH